MTNFAFNYSPLAINVLIDGRARAVDNTHPNFNALKDAIKKGAPTGTFDLDLIRSLIDIPSFVAKATVGRVQIGGDRVLFDGNEIKGFYVTRLIAMLQEGLPIEPLARYLERREQNPVLTAKEELDLFIEGGKNPITNDGCIVAFKKVQDDLTSYHRGKDGRIFLHTVGSTLEVDESEVDTNRYNTCSSGLHFCSYSYLSHYYGGQGRVVIVKIDPADIRAIPVDYNHSKGRALRYTVIGEIPEEEAQQFFDGQHVTDMDSFLYQNDTDSDASDEETPDYGYDGEPDPLDDDGDQIDATVGDEAGEPPEALTVSEIKDILNDDLLATDDRAAILLEAFDWSDCVQGEQFWDAQYVRLLNGDDLTDKAIEILADWLDQIERDQKTFKSRDGRLFTVGEIKELVASHGQRGFSRITGIPRTTLQEWLKQIS